MCGIIGILHFNDKPVDNQIVKKLNSLISHRGPDEVGYFFYENYGCAISRLSIIDLKEGSQPIFRRNNELVIVFNGELYNFKDIREILEKKGGNFHTKSDTEVVLAAYEEWGENCLEYFNGIYAFAIYDIIKKELFIARDRIGIKQLYYYFDKEQFIFGSEMKILLNLPYISKNLNLSALSNYFTYGYTGYDETPIKNILILKPAHWMKIKSNGNIETKCYWQIPSILNSEYKTEEEAAENIYFLLVDAVNKQLVADVEICVMLSSGLDSSTLAYILHKELKTSMHAFSIGLREPEFDESQDAGKLAKYYQMELNSDFIYPEKILNDFKKIIHHSDSLQGNTAQIIYYYCNKLIKENGYKVTLNGNGGDELFIGYPTYQADTVFSYYRHFPSFIKKCLGAITQQIPTSFGRVTLDYKLKKFFEFQNTDKLKAHAYWRTIFTSKDQKYLFKKEFHEKLNNWYIIYGDFFKNMDKNMPFLNKVQIADLYCWLIPMLPWVDNISMAHSVELRVPFLDHRIVEKVMTLPPHFKFDGWKLKKIMKTFLHHKLPETTLNIKKRGTHIPLGKWLNNELSVLIKGYLTSYKLNRLGLFNMQEVEKLINEHSNKNKDNTFKLWNLIVFSAWLDEFNISL